MIACLPMYDWEEIRPATDRLWGLIRDGLARAGIAAPLHLSRGGDLWEAWLDPGLVLAQTCSMPYRTRLHDRVELVGTPDYGLPDAPDGHYYSQLVVRADRPGGWQDFLSGTLAINDPVSQSGWAAPQAHAAAAGARFDRLIETGSHCDSALAVAEGRADIAAIDAVTWRLVQRFRPGTAARLRVAARTAPTPGLPMITAAGNDANAVAEAVRAAIVALPQADCDSLGLKGWVALPKAAYLGVPTPAH